MVAVEQIEILIYNIEIFTGKIVPRIKPEGQIIYFKNNTSIYTSLASKNILHLKARLRNILYVVIQT